MKLVEVARFASKIEVTDDCHIWRGAASPDGYGTAYWQGKTRKVHRLAYELAYGPIPDGMNVCHRCDNPPCCNLDHLFLGSQSDNMRDAHDKGRLAGITTKQDHFHAGHAPRGEAGGGARLTEAQAIEIMSRASAGALTSILAVEFGIERSTVQRLLRGETWKHLARPEGLPRAIGYYRRDLGRASLKQGEPM